MAAYPGQTTNPTANPMMNSILNHAAVLTLSHEQEAHLCASPQGQELLAVFEKQALVTVFQPIIDLQQRTIFAHEALIRGPKNSFLHSPLNLLQVAEEHGCLFEIDWLARLLSIHSFQHQQATALLFLNVTVNTIMQKSHKSGITLEYLGLLGIPVGQVVIEITELQPVEDFSAFVESVNHYRKMGFKVAIDDLGAGYNGLRIWSELRPDFVKIDHHFISGIDLDSDKYRFMETICALGKSLGTKIVAEGIETYGEMLALEKLGVDYAQGFLFRRPQETINDKLDFDWHTLDTAGPQHQESHPTAAGLLQETFAISPNGNIMDVARFFLANPQIMFIPVVHEAVVHGMIWREKLMSHIVRAFEYFANPEKSLQAVIDTEVVIIPVETSLKDLVNILTSKLSNMEHPAFILTEKGHYRGCGELKEVLRLLAR